MLLEPTHQANKPHTLQFLLTPFLLLLLSSPLQSSHQAPALSQFPHHPHTGLLPPKADSLLELYGLAHTTLAMVDLHTLNMSQPQLDTKLCTTPPNPPLTVDQ